jgi:hypothetical protein
MQNAKTRLREQFVCATINYEENLQTETKQAEGAFTATSPGFNMVTQNVSYFTFWP